jgi:hypothetical protein
VVTCIFDYFTPKHSIKTLYSISIVSCLLSFRLTEYGGKYPSKVQFAFSHDSFRPEDNQQDEYDSHQDLAGAINRWELDKTKVYTSLGISEDF